MNIEVLLREADRMIESGRTDKAVEAARLLKTLSDEVSDGTAEKIQSALLAHKELVFQRDQILKPIEDMIGRAKNVVAYQIGEATFACPEGVSITKKFRVARVENPGQVPARFLVPDLKKIEAYANETGGTMAVPGVEIEPKYIVTIRSLKDSKSSPDPAGA